MFISPPCSETPKWITSLHEKGRRVLFTLTNGPVPGFWTWILSEPFDSWLHLALPQFSAQTPIVLGLRHQTHTVHSVGRLEAPSQRRLSKRRPGFRRFRDPPETGRCVSAGGCLSAGCDILGTDGLKPARVITLEHEVTTAIWSIVWISAACRCRLQGEDHISGWKQGKAGDMGEFKCSHFD